MQEIALRIAPLRPRARSTALALRRAFETWPDVPVRIAAIEEHGSRTVLTVAIGLGDGHDVRDGSRSARRATALLASLVDRFADCDPALVPPDVPAPESASP